MRKAIYRVSSLWFSAWVDAGQPELDESEQFREMPLDSINKKLDKVSVRNHDY
ncbi:MAG: hypothetical protein L3J29_10145 [Cyclobacteriaceae bacterium]|nr:hypothetical protein [Cyclobacteriaceae bacterium]